MRIISLAILLCGFIKSSEGHGGKINGISQRNLFLYEDYDVLRHISSLREYGFNDIMSELTDVMEGDNIEWNTYTYFNDEAAENIQDQYFECGQCRAFLSAIQNRIQAGATFEDLRNISINVCYTVTAEDYERNDILCPGVVDIYGPHVVWILNHTSYDAHEICIFNRLCSNTTEQKGANVLKPEKYNPKHFGINTKKFMSVPTEKVERKNYDDMLKVIHLTDFHVDVEYLEGTVTDCGLPVCCREYMEGTGYASMWGEYSCNLPPRTMESFLLALQNFTPDYVMYTGDNPPHRVWEEDLNDQLTASRFVTEALGRNLPGIPMHMCIGNHETFPTNLYYRQLPETQIFNRAARQYWQPLINFGPEQIETFEYAAYYTQVIQPGLRVVSYNSNYGNNKNFYGIITVEEAEVDDMLLFLNQSMETARMNGEKVILLGHHRSGSLGYFEFYEDFMEWLTISYGDIIVLHLNGHSHKDRFHMGVDDNGTGQVVWFSSPAMTSSTNINPSARIFYLDPITFEPLDFDNYYMDLNGSIGTDLEPQVEFVYRATEEYGVEDISPSSWLNFVDRMFEDDELYYKYAYNENTRRDEPKPCTGECRVNAICDLKTLTATAKDECIATMQKHVF